jgi:anti-sigma regulatory factor (Ser/Thr protein kinase)
VASTVREETFLPTNGAVREARRFAAAAVGADGADGSELGDRLVLVTSELVSNAVLHARSVFTVRIVIDDLTVRVAVHDASSSPPIGGDVVAGSVSGRGLAIVAALASRWGVDLAPDGTGKRVWAELQR